ncbi:MAG: shikimate kinase [Deltaproteobacteria bacterium]|nr:shikimate kinase [Deltaproteobacteria bacterium]
MNIVLVGFMASGKTSLGRKVAHRLGYRFLDTDHFIEKETGLEISRIFAQQGEAAFRGLETALARNLKGLNNHVISTGGGILTTPGNLEHLQQAGLVLFLNTDPEEIIARLEKDTRRPLAQGGDLRQKVTDMLAARMAQYMAADVVIDTRGKSGQQVAGEVIRVAAKYQSAHPEPNPRNPSDEPEPNPNLHP